jgi:outer membrane protein OmpA-like peptidoglycan-associated protein
VQEKVHESAVRLRSGAAAALKNEVPIANDADAPYCTPAFKTVLERVLHACGLVGADSRRGCQPADIKSLAQISDDDFNALFTPLKSRGAVILFDDGSEKLDDGAKKIIEDLWVDRRGARYFFVVARASKTGTPDYNRALSHKRANSVLFLVNDQFKDPEIDKQVGLLWLGNEFAQLGKEYCEWNVSRDRKKCSAEAINRSAFVSWVDCQL